jgi:hypothetical protein
VTAEHASGEASGRSRENVQMRPDGCDWVGARTVTCWSRRPEAALHFAMMVARSPEEKDEVAPSEANMLRSSDLLSRPSLSMSYLSNASRGPFFSAMSLSRSASISDFQRKSAGHHACQDRGSPCNEVIQCGSPAHCSSTVKTLATGVSVHRVRSRRRRMMLSCGESVESQLRTSLVSGELVS